MPDWTVHSLLDLASNGLPWLAAGVGLGLVLSWVLVRRRPRRWRDEGIPAPTGSRDAVGSSESSDREALHRRLQAALAGERNADGAPALAVVNLDNFRLVNDGFGHAAGDALLAEAATRIRAALRHTDTPARIGGDEFLVLLENTGGAAPALAVAERLRAAVSQPYHVAGQRFQLSASVGLALSPRHGHTAEDLVRSATAAMSAIKRRGGDGVELPTMIAVTDASERVRIEAELRRALDRDEFELHYQPKFALVNGETRLTGAEALLRWNHPERGTVPPGSFIAIAEETGLIVPIGDWTLREATAAARRWNADPADAPATVAVNLSFRQFDRPDLFEFVRDTVRESRLEPALLELELTESTLMRNTEVTIDVLRRLRALGVQLSIDDFGTGYSSLSLLKRLPVCCLKIDRSFMREVPENGEDTAIATAILRLAHSLGLSVVAEGVEREAQLGFLRSRGCNAVQGFLLGHPMSEADFRSALAGARRPTAPRNGGCGVAGGTPALAIALPSGVE